MSSKRMTKQRKTVLEKLKNTRSHPTASELYWEVRKEIPQVSLGTIYRNLNVLTELGEIQEININNKVKRYDGNPEKHYHFFCQDCGRVYDLDGDYQKDLDKKFEKNNQHKITHHFLDFYGTCRNCLKDS